MSESDEFSITLSQESDYVFRIAFDETSIPDLMTDESAPVGTGSGPNPARLLAAAVANCLSASLVFALRKYKNSPNGLVARARTRIERNARNRLRIAKVDVAIELPDAAADYAHVERLLEQFENFCIVTQSVRAGISVEVSVRDAAGTLLHDSTNASAAEATWMI